ncbi:kinesin family member 2/24 [Strigomonas culicis]|uniref:Kinesin-like protein n=1 Tax=Strigomonas culicis TaxID=28005 RepID=S9U304_9TRYP|nr:kinesin family member 2/24 [Strigomonas culicis]|eukprot:EPY25167.1 kinesin family member 2/24 [Strigomonas culicis]
MLQDENKNLHIIGLKERDVRTVEDVQSLMQSGQQLRAIGTTHANDRSSRSHAVLEIKLKISKSDTIGRMTFVDLAGSERASDTSGTDAKTRREGAEINKSLLALKECIRAMSMHKRHIPFRGSKLTQILRESFVGRSRTCVVATVSPCRSHCEDTLNTLRYADRIKELKGPTTGALAQTPIPCRNCGLAIFAGEQHVCQRRAVQCPHCREEVDKADLEKHLKVCKDCPTRCTYCNERMLRGDVPRHNRRCVRMPLRCAACGQAVPRGLMERHAQMECAEARAKCRYCGTVFVRQALQAHESSCDAMKVACTFCLKFVRKKALESHEAGCPMNHNRVVPPNASVERIAPGSLQSRLPNSPITPPSYSLEHTPSGTNASLEAESSILAAQSSQPQMRRSHPDARASLSPSPGRSPGLNKEEDATSVCPYARYGCPVKVTRLNLTAHLAEAIADHLELVTSYADRADMQNAQLRRLIVKQGK